MELLKKIGRCLWIFFLNLIIALIIITLIFGPIAVGIIYKDNSLILGLYIVEFCGFLAVDKVFNIFK